MYNFAKYWGFWVEHLLSTPFQKPIKLAKPKDFSTMSGLITQTNFIKKIISINPLDKDFVDYEKLRKSGLDEQQALTKLQINTVHPSG